MELVSRNKENDENVIKEEILNQVSIEYTNYAVSVDGNNITYVSNMKEAEDIIEELKEEYSKKYTEKLGIIQVYANNYEEISSVDTKTAKITVSDELKKVKKADSAKSTKEKAKRNIKIAKESNINGIKFTINPVSGIITSRFGYRSSPGGVGTKNHKGLDIAAPNGTIIRAVAKGTVEFSGRKGALGKLVIINHGNGVKTYYAHCSDLKVSQGQQVNEGDNIATVGRTGTATGNHLHFEVHLNGVCVNPQKYIY